MSKLRRVVVKAARACDDWYEDEAPYYYAGTSYELSDDAPRFRSVSPAAHRAIHGRSSATIGFHRPRA